MRPGCLLTAVVAVGGVVALGRWADVSEYPSRTASARLDLLGRDAVLPALQALAGTPTTGPRTEHCRDTPDGRRPPDVYAEYATPTPAPSAERLTRLAAEAGWRADHVIRHTPDSYTLNLTKPFDGWTSAAIVTVDPAFLSVELDASENDDCP